jgi:NADH-quinone oxidoreductase subunit C
VEPLSESLGRKFGDSLRIPTRYAVRDGIASLEVPAADITKIVAFLRDESVPRFEQLSSVTATDEYPEVPRFRVVYHFYSFAENVRLRLVARIPELPGEIDSITPLFPGANWQEREAFDMFGVIFLGHPDLKRILMPDDYGHFPLRKEFPLRGIEPERQYHEWNRSRKA